jgi:hypothetical protein
MGTYPILLKYPTIDFSLGFSKLGSCIDWVMIQDKLRK